MYKIEDVLLFNKRNDAEKSLEWANRSLRHGLSLWGVRVTLLLLIALFLSGTCDQYWMTSNVNTFCNTWEVLEDTSASVINVFKFPPRFSLGLFSTASGLALYRPCHFTYAASRQ